VTFDKALWQGKVPDPAYRDEDTTAIREVCESLRADDHLVPLLLPVGDGLLAGVKRGE
jgi:predicted O-methyltransferase YrrM